MKKGFTLVELIAVIAILAVIALITTPIVTGTINNSKKRSYELEATNIAEEIKARMLDSNLQMNGVYTKEQVKSLIGMEIKGEQIIVTTIDDSPKVIMIKDGQEYSSK